MHTNPLYWPLRIFCLLEIIDKQKEPIATRTLLKIIRRIEIQGHGCEIKIATFYNDLFELKRLGYLDEIHNTDSHPSWSAYRLTKKGRELITSVRKTRIINTHAEV